MKLHFQVTVMDKQDYIIEYCNFQYYQIEYDMLKYIESFFNHPEAQNIRITRWNDNNERA